MFQQITIFNWILSGREKRWVNSWIIPEWNSMCIEEEMTGRSRNKKNKMTDKESN